MSNAHTKQAKGSGRVFTLSLGGKGYLSHQGTDTRPYVLLDIPGESTSASHGEKESW